MMRRYVFAEGLVLLGDRVVPWVNPMGCSSRRGVGLKSEGTHVNSRPPSHG